MKGNVPQAAARAPAACRRETIGCDTSLFHTTVSANGVVTVDDFADDAYCK
jgi:hypothetical protein